MKSLTARSRDCESVFAFVFRKSYPQQSVSNKNLIIVILLRVSQLHFFLIRYPVLAPHTAANKQNRLLDDREMGLVCHIQRLSLGVLVNCTHDGAAQGKTQGQGSRFLFCYCQVERGSLSWRKPRFILLHSLHKQLLCMQIEFDREYVGC
jgi:hypothetical protein